LCQIFLGPGAIRGEEQIIKVLSYPRTGKVTKTIARLQGGSIENFPVELKFSASPVVFRLVKGSGPVHLIGSHMFGKLNRL
jgi:nucleophosmin 3